MAWIRKHLSQMIDSLWSNPLSCPTTDLVRCELSRFWTSVAEIVQPTIDHTQAMVLCHPCGGSFQPPSAILYW